MPKKDQKPEKEITSARSIPKETSTFVGLVDSPGGGGLKTGRQKRWNFSATIVAWRCNGGPVVQEPINVIDTQIAEISLTNRMKQFAKNSIIKFNAKRARRGSWLYPPVELTKFAGTAKDKSLAKIKREREKPVIINDRLFGAVTFDRDIQWFETDKFHESDDTHIVFIATTPEDAKKLVHAAKPFWRGRKKWFREFREIAFEQMYETSEWHFESEGKQLSPKIFKELLVSPSMVTFYNEDGVLGFTLAGSSDELFGEHDFQVSGTLSNGLDRD